MVEGEVLAAVEFAPRPDFGHVPVRLEGIDDGLRAVGTARVCDGSSGLRR
jgi:hypothetical protein